MEDSEELEKWFEGRLADRCATDIFLVGVVRDEAWCRCMVSSQSIYLLVSIVYSNASLGTPVMQMLEI